MSLRASGCTAGVPANRGGTSIIADYFSENFELIVPDESPLEASAPAAQAADIPAPPESHPSLHAEADRPEVDDATRNRSESTGEEVLDDNSWQEAAPDHAKTRRVAHPRVPLIERFATGQGFAKRSEASYEHPDGRRIARAPGSVFPWELWSSHKRVCSYWPKDHCLERAPLELPVEVWELCDRQPQTHALLLVTPNELPLELHGARLREQLTNGSLTVHPAAYRLILLGS